MRIKTTYQVNVYYQSQDNFLCSKEYKSREKADRVADKINDRMDGRFAIVVESYTEFNIIPYRG